MRIDGQTLIDGVGEDSNIPKKSEQRSYALDGLRGLAALSVVLLHLISVFLETSFEQYHWVDRAFQILSYTPIAAIWDGGAAVLIFFVLSGFALHRMLGAGKMSYGNYAIRRILRLWLPYAAAILLALISVYFIGSHIIPGQSDWLNAKLGTKISASLIAQHAIMIGVFKFNLLDFVIWSLVQEMRISLLFPLIYFALKKYPPTLVLLVSFIIQLFSLLIISHGHGKYTDTSLIVTLKYQIYFVVGAIISLNEENIRKYVEDMKIFSKLLCFLAVLVLYSNCLKIPTLFPTLIGAVGIVIIAVSEPNIRRILNLRPIQFLGKISYSLYLLHAVVLLSLINLLYPEFSFSLIVVISIPVIFMSTYLLNRFVEVPSIKLSRMAGKPRI